MIRTGKTSQVPGNVLIIGIGTVLALFLYGVFCIYPAYRALGQIQKEAGDEAVGLARLKILFPVQARAKALEKIRFTGRLPFPKRAAMPRKSLTALPEKFTAMARTHGMALSSTNFDLNSMHQASTSLSLTLELKGRLRDFRQFLINIIAHPSFDSISFLQIRSAKGEAKEITLTLGIRIEEDRA